MPHNIECNIILNAAHYLTHAAHYLTHAPITQHMAYCLTHAAHCLTQSGQDKQMTQPNLPIIKITLFMTWIGWQAGTPPPPPPPHTHFNELTAGKWVRGHPFLARASPVRRWVWGVGGFSGYGCNIEPFTLYKLWYDMTFIPSNPQNFNFRRFCHIRVNVIRVNVAFGFMSPLALCRLRLYFLCGFMSHAG